MTGRHEPAASARDTEGLAEAYAHGSQDAMAEARRDLAAVLRIYAVGAGEEGEERLSDDIARAIYTSMFGVRETELQFGPEPTGAIDIDKIVARQRDGRGSVGA